MWGKRSLTYWWFVRALYSYTIWYSIPTKKGWIWKKRLHSVHFKTPLIPTFIRTTNPFLSDLGNIRTYTLNTQILKYQEIRSSTYKVAQRKKIKQKRAKGEKERKKERKKKDPKWLWLCFIRKSVCVQSFFLSLSFLSPLSVSLCCLGRWMHIEVCFTSFPETIAYKLLTDFNLNVKWCTEESDSNIIRWEIGILHCSLLNVCII